MHRLVHEIKRNLSIIASDKCEFRLHNILNNLFNLFNLYIVRDIFIIPNENIDRIEYEKFVMLNKRI